MAKGLPAFCKLGLFGKIHEYMKTRIQGYKNVELGLFCEIIFFATEGTEG
jgi:hypothetical protein